MSGGQHAEDHTGCGAPPRARQQPPHRSWASPPPQRRITAPRVISTWCLTGAGHLLIHDRQFERSRTQATSSWELVRSDHIHAMALEAVETAAQQLGGDQIIETGHDDDDAQPDCCQRNVLQTWPLGTRHNPQPSWHPPGSEMRRSATSSAPDDEEAHTPVQQHQRNVPNVAIGTAQPSSDGQAAVFAELNARSSARSRRRTPPPAPEHQRVAQQDQTSERPMSSHEQLLLPRAIGARHTPGPEGQRRWPAELSADSDFQTRVATALPSITQTNNGHPPNSSCSTTPCSSLKNRLQLTPAAPAARPSAASPPTSASTENGHIDHRQLILQARTAEPTPTPAAPAAMAHRQPA